MLFINTAMCVMDKSQARYGGEFVRAVVDAIKTCTDPRACEFVCPFVYCRHLLFVVILHIAISCFCTHNQDVQ